MAQEVTISNNERSFIALMAALLVLNICSIDESIKKVSEKTISCTAEPNPKERTE